jgi:hypothetical protein
MLSYTYTILFIYKSIFLYNIEALLRLLRLLPFALLYVALFISDYLTSLASITNMVKKTHIIIHYDAIQDPPIKPIFICNGKCGECREKQCLTI